MPSSVLSSLAGKLCKAASPSPLPLTSVPYRCLSVKVKSKKAQPEGQLKPKPKPQPGEAKSKLSGGAQIIYRVSSSLASILQTSETTRPDALKRIWDYIKAHKLQNNTNKSQIVCDPALKKAFGQDNLKVSEVLKYLNPHLSRKV